MHSIRIGEHYVLTVPSILPLDSWYNYSWSLYPINPLYVEARSVKRELPQHEIPTQIPKVYHYTNRRLYYQCSNHLIDRELSVQRIIHFALF